MNAQIEPQGDGDQQKSCEKLGSSVMMGFVLLILGVASLLFWVTKPLRDLPPVSDLMRNGTATTEDAQGLFASIPYAIDFLIPLFGFWILIAGWRAGGWAGKKILWNGSSATLVGTAAIFLTMVISTCMTTTFPRLAVTHWRQLSGPWEVMMQILKPFFVPILSSALVAMFLGAVYGACLQFFAPKAIHPNQTTITS